MIGESPASAKDPQTVAKEANLAAGLIDKYAGELAAVTPPSDAAAANTEVVDGFHKIAALFRQMADAAKSGNVAKLRSFAKALSTGPATRELQKAKRELQKAGYTFKANA